MSAEDDQFTQTENSHGSCAQSAGLAAWRCPWCNRSNDRQHEGLDTCEHCGSEAKTHYSRTDDERLIVVIAYEPEKRPNAKLCEPAKEDQR